MKAQTSELVSLWLCNACGSPDPEVRIWIHANTDETTNECDSDGDCFCPACESESTLDAFEVVGNNRNLSAAMDHARRWSEAFHGALASGLADYHRND